MHRINLPGVRVRAGEFPWRVEKDPLTVDVSRAVEPELGKIATPPVEGPEFGLSGFLIPKGLLSDAVQLVQWELGIFTTVPGPIRRLFVMAGAYLVFSLLHPDRLYPTFPG